MTRKFNFLQIIFLLIVFFSCREETRTKEFNQGPEGIFYKLISIGNDGRRPELNDVLMIKAKYKCHSDSLFWSSETDAASGYFFKIDQLLLKSKFWGFIFKKYSAGDSLQIKVSTTLFFKEVFNAAIPNFALKDSFIKTDIMIQKIMNQSEYEKYRDGDFLRAEASSWDQKLQIENYVKNHMKNPTMLDSLLYMDKINISEGGKLKFGENINLVYKGSFLNGKIFDNRSENEPLSITYGANKQIIRGLEIALRNLKKGESAKIIIPSHLGFSDSFGVVVPPKTPLIYELQIIEKK